MKKLLLSMTAGVAAIAMAPAANAAQTITITGPSGFFGDDSVQAGSSSVAAVPGVGGFAFGTGPGTTGGAGSFTRTFTFLTPTGFNLTNVVANNVASDTLTNLDFSSVTLNGVAFTLTGGVIENATLLNQALIQGGNNILTLSGVTGGDAALSGNLSFSAVPAIPEPATWAFMLIGFGAVGYSMRKRPAYKLAQAV